MPIDAIRDVIPKTVPHHSFPISFPDAVALAEPAEGVAAGVRAFFFYAKLPQCALHVPPEL